MEQFPLILILGAVMSGAQYGYLCLNPVLRAFHENTNVSLGAVMSGADISEPSIS